MKIIDCFIFYNELELLTYRLNVLNDVVDYFVLVESKHTFIGKEKSLYYNENKKLFDKFNEKIIHIIVDDFPYKYPNIDFNNSEQWVNEIFQRNCIPRGLNEIQLNDDDLIMISDLDEIPDLNTLYDIKNGNILVTINAFEMDYYYYNLNSKFNPKWCSSKIISYKNYKELNMTCHDIRMLENEIIKKGGWHLSCFGDAYFIQNKLLNSSHQEYAITEFTDITKIEERIINNRDVFDRDLYDTNAVIQKISINENDYLPIEFDNYLKNFFT
jgi:beta-1,4-mannosyl-glycoprotein beta-1,4-N-acetylglucosaminyltransferase